MILMHMICLGFVLLGAGCSSNLQIAAKNGDSDVISVETPTPIPSPVLKKKDGKWQAAEFRTIKVGTDKREKVLKMFGKPVWTGDAPDETGLYETGTEIWDQYQNIDEMYGLVTFMSTIKDGKVFFIEAQVPSLPVEVVLQRFGDNYQRKEYVKKLCKEDDPESVVEVEGHGPYKSVYYIYPEQGIAIVTQNDVTVYAVQYRSNPVVPDDARCPNWRVDNSPIQ